MASSIEKDSESESLPPAQVEVVIPPLIEVSIPAGELTELAAVAERYVKDQGT